jgi:uncharacterized protein YutE (UPF0331/DUF86 family)
VSTLVDKDLLTRKLQDLERYLKQLRKHQGVTAEKLDNDLDKAWIIGRGLQLCIQLVLDIGNHILAEAGVSVQEYADILPQLAKLDIIPDDYAISVKGIAGFRNLLVHEYSEIDNEKLAAFVNVNLTDIYLFCKYIVAYNEDNDG